MTKINIENTISETIITAYKKWYDKPYIWKNIDGAYHPKTYGEIIGVSFSLSQYFTEQGIINDNVAIFAKNSAEWVSADYAVTLSSNVSLLIDASWQLFEITNIVKFIEPKVFLYDESTKSIAMEIKNILPNTLFLAFEDLPAAKKVIPKLPKPRDPNGLAKIFFSSGTTGKPKAIMLSEANMLFGWNEISNRMVGIGPDDSCYVFLPFHHVYANVIILLYVLPIGCQIYLCSDIKNVKKELLLSRPSIIHGVPLFFERIYGAITPSELHKANIAIKIANAIHLPVAIRKIIFSKIHKALGGHIKYLLSGGARLDPTIRKFFYDVGLEIISAYASTETSGSLFASVGSKKFNSVGLPYAGINAKINSEDVDGVGEIIVKGPNVFLGYYNNEEANKTAFDEDGYFHTGDLGKFDEDGELYIVGRKKRMILLSNGENVWPDEIENLFEKSKYIVSTKVFYRNEIIEADVTISGEADKIIAAKYCQNINAKLPKYSKIGLFNYKVADESIRIKK